LSEGKKNCLILDFTDNCDKRSLMDYPTLFGLPESYIVETDAIEEKEMLDEFAINHPWIDLSKLKNIRELPTVESDISFFRTTPPTGIVQFTHNQWIPISDGYRLPIGDREAIEVRSTRLDTHNVWAISGRDVHFLDERTKLGEAIKFADRWVKAVRKKSLKLIDLRKKWRLEPATKKQKKFLKRKGIPFPVEISKGQAATIIAMRIEGR
jgi:hypothetical protein